VAPIVYLKTESAGLSKTWVNLRLDGARIPQDSILDSYIRDNLKYHQISYLFHRIIQFQ